MEGLKEAVSSGSVSTQPEILEGCGAGDVEIRTLAAEMLERTGG